MSDFIPFKGSNYQIVYVDNTTVGGAADGSSISNALHAFPAAPALSASCLYLIRRTNYIDIPRGSITADNVMVMGMPSVTGDYFYLNLPSPVVTAWGTDAISATSIYLSGPANTPWDFGTTNNNGGFGIFNLSMYCPLNVTQSLGAVHMFGAGATIQNCIVSVSGAPLSGNATLTAMSPFVSVRLETAEGLTFVNNDVVCYGISNDSPTSDGQASIALYIKDPTPNIHVNSYIANSTFRSIHTGNQPYYKVYGLYGNGAFYDSYFGNLNFINTKNIAANGGFQHMHIATLMNSCIVENITCNSTPNTQTSTSYTSYGIQIDYGSGGGSDSDQYKYLGRHTFNNINIYDQPISGGTYYGMYLGQRFTDCTFNNINIQVPRASNAYGYGGLVFGQYYNHHNSFNNLNINYGAALADPVTSPTVDCFAFQIDQSSNMNTAKNYLTNSTLQCSRIALAASNMDVSNTAVTGSVYINGDAVQLNSVTVNPKTSLFTTQPASIHIKGVNTTLVNTDGSPSYYVPSNDVMRIGNYVNNSGVLQNIEYTYGLVTVDAASGGVALNLLGVSDGYAGKIYLNNYPQPGYWLASNYWHKLTTNAVQYVTSDGITGGFSLMAQTLNTPGAAFPVQHQAIIVSPPPYTGNTVVTSAAPLGQHTLTLYVATKYATALTAKDIWFEVKVPDGTGTAYKSLTTYGSKFIVQPDATTVWYGDAPLVLYKIVMNFNLDRAENIYSRIYWNKTMVAGSSFAYIAPTLVFR